ncbi:WG repeat-containing protein [Chryseobacterium sp. Leaf394]|uniref:WG repeat-containing protein n=1 Tax=Chryseobacterium sp. Leaf394 TaxID=1736361 RepID=UPI001F51C894|nr:WG repeat-containing protein [Chryseobacterium sp. Leaf394]
MMTPKIPFKMTLLAFTLFSLFLSSQSKTLKTKPLSKVPVKKTAVRSSVSDDVLPKDVIVLDEEVPVLIPQKKDGKFGYVNQNGKFIIQPEYHIALFFGEDCNLLYSPNEKVKKFGSKNYATVDKGGVSYRINMSGKIVYTYKPADLGVCKAEYKKARFHAYRLNGKYGLIEDGRFVNPADKKQFTIYPSYDFLFVMETNDVANPMIIAASNDKFGIIDTKNQIVIPFEYRDIKRNYSWKLGKMFEVTKDDVNYYYIDIHNKSYK